MILEFEDEKGQKHRYATKVEINGEVFYITLDKEIYNENGSNIKDDEIEAHKEILEKLKPYLEEPRSLDVIFPEDDKQNDDGDER